MANPAVRAAGTKVRVRISGVFTLIPGVRGFTGPGGEAGDIETTPIDTTTAKEYLVDLADPGTFTFKVNYMPSNVVHKYLIAAWKAGTEERIQLEYSTGEQTEFSAFVKNFPRAGEQGQALNADASLKITGDIVDP